MWALSKSKKKAQKKLGGRWRNVCLNLSIPLINQSVGSCLKCSWRFQRLNFLFGYIYDFRICVSKAFEGRAIASEFHWHKDGLSSL